jgi:hypothetical protein
MVVGIPKRQRTIADRHSAARFDERCGAELGLDGDDDASDAPVVARRGLSLGMRLPRPYSSF